MSYIIPYKGLRRIAFRKYRRNWSTMDLMAVAANDHERALVAIVALMDVKEDQRYLGISGIKWEFMRRCHRYIESVLVEPNAEQVPIVDYLIDSHYNHSPNPHPPRRRLLPHRHL